MVVMGTWGSTGGRGKHNCQHQEHVQMGMLLVVARWKIGHETPRTRPDGHTFGVRRVEGKGIATEHEEHAQMGMPLVISRWGGEGLSGRRGGGSGVAVGWLFLPSANVVVL